MSQCNFRSTAQKDSYLSAPPCPVLAAEDWENPAEISTSRLCLLQWVAESKVLSEPTSVLLPPHFSTSIYQTCVSFWGCCTLAVSCLEQVQGETLCSFKRKAPFPAIMCKISLKDMMCVPKRSEGQSTGLNFLINKSWIFQKLNRHTPTPQFIMVPT